ncbi:MAG: diphthine synthase [Methanoregula sp.]|jgi:diphthine synthase|uniref:diphthine synthase n=1 Tax=Methanoregula sp. TaxID=2052170 RepID=UPI003C180274
MLTFIGIGLYDKRDISEKGLRLIRNSEYVFLEGYTSRLMGATKDELEAYYQKPVRLLMRADVEQHPDELLDCALHGNTVFLCAGDPMVSTTHADIRIRAADRGIPTAIIHGASIVSAVCGLSGLQNYRFGKSCSVPFPQAHWSPTSPLDVIVENRNLRLHTLVYLDIQDERYMTVNEAVGLLEGMARKKQVTIPLYVGIARAGSDAPVVRAGTAEVLRSVDFGPPLHVLVVPGDLHDMERMYLARFASLC